MAVIFEVGIYSNLYIYRAYICIYTQICVTNIYKRVLWECIIQSNLYIKTALGTKWSGIYTQVVSIYRLHRDICNITLLNTHSKYAPSIYSLYSCIPNMFQYLLLQRVQLNIFLQHQKYKYLTWTKKSYKSMCDFDIWIKMSPSYMYLQIHILVMGTVKYEGGSRRSKVTNLYYKTLKCE